MTALTAAPAWQALLSHHALVKDLHLRDLFAKDPGRAERLCAEGAGLFLDYSKNRITDETLRLLLQLAAERGVLKRRDAMFAGEKINTTERRAVLHVAAIDAAGDMRVTDIWESQEALDAFFAERLGPAFQRMGEPMPDVELMTVAHNINAYPAVDRYKV